MRLVILASDSWFDYIKDYLEGTGFSLRDLSEKEKIEMVRAFAEYTFSDRNTTLSEMLLDGFEEEASDVLGDFLEDEKE